MEDSIYDIETKETYYEGDPDFRVIKESGVNIAPFIGKPYFTVQEQIENDIQQAKDLAYQKLLVTDWYIIRKFETGKEIPIEVSNERVLIKKELEEKITALSEELKNEL